MAANQKYLTSSDLKTINGNSIVGEGNLGIDSLVETTWSALKQLRDSSGLTPGVQYRITDYNTTTAQENTQAAGHQFDVIVVADDNHTLNENARAALHSGDTYFSTAGAKLDAWELKYSIDNDTNRFAWADSGSTGRGVIYRMIDEWGNDCPYDFKNIQFARYEQTNPVGYKYDESQGDYVQDSDQSWVSRYNLKAGFYSIDGSSNDVMLFFDEEDLYQYKKKISYTVSSTPTYCYTFGRGLDTSLGEKVYNNVIKEYYESNKLLLNNIVFLQTDLSQNCCANTFGSDCYSNTFGSGCYYNILDYGCSSNIFGYSCSKNTFGSECYANTFGKSCSYNTFGSYVVCLIAGSTTGATTSAQTKNYIRYLIVENGVQNVNVYCTGTTSPSNYCQNIKIKLGVKGASSSNRLQIDVTSQIGATDCVTYQTANSHVINI